MITIQVKSNLEPRECPKCGGMGSIAYPLMELPQDPPCDLCGGRGYVTLRACPGCGRSAYADEKGLVFCGREACVHYLLPSPNRYFARWDSWKEGSD